MDSQGAFIQLLTNAKNINLIYVGIKILINSLLFVLLIFTLYYLVHIGNRYVNYKYKIKFNRKIYIIIFLTVIAIIFMIIFYVYRNVIISNLIPIIWAVIFAYLLNPLICKLMEYRLSRFWSVTIVYFGIFLIMAIFSFTVTPRMTKEIKNFTEILPSYTNRTFNFINNLYYKYMVSMNSLPPEFVGIDVALREYLNNIQVHIIDLFRHITQKGLNFFSNLVGIVLVPIYAFYFLKDTDYFKKKVIISIPAKFREEMISIFKDINKVLSRFIRGQLVIAAIVGILSIFALLILKVRFAFLIGTIAGISNVVPYFGPIIGTVPAVIVALLDEPIKALWVILAFFTIQQIESAVLSPKIVGDSVGLHPIFVILVLLVGGEMFGIIGLLFAVPFAASIKVIMKHIVKMLIKI
ncbi:AI-2E family transporter [Caminicella sporogenes]|uniref:AI-2E family transporter n=1 Tax=Caminicella sporogenes TaxID=166485 RepID=UPI002540DC8D|nr:AI-2E family transporter [Caminicella sporogenes]WIF94490.1 AI-2E family transporter [Caminicella sporogenes]